MRLDIDPKNFDLLDTKIELALIKEHFHLLCDEIKKIQDSQWQMFTKMVADGNLDKDEEEAEYGICSQRITTIIPRLFWGPFLVSLWAVLEFSFIEISNSIGSIMNLTLKRDDFKGSTLEQFEKYFKHVLKIEHMPSDLCWESIQDFQLLRNAFAHKSGIFSLLNEKQRKRLTILEKRGIGIEISNSWIIVEKKYVETIMAEVKTLIEHLIAQHNSVKYPIASETIKLS